MLFEVIAHFSYFNQFKLNVKKLAQELETENSEGLTNDLSASTKPNLSPKPKGNCTC